MLCTKNTYLLSMIQNLKRQESIISKINLYVANAVFIATSHMDYFQVCIVRWPRVTLNATIYMNVHSTRLPRRPWQEIRHSHISHFAHSLWQSLTAEHPSL